MFCQAVILNTALFCTPSHNEPGHAYLLLLAFVFCVALSGLQKSARSCDWRGQNKPAPLSGTAPVQTAAWWEDSLYPSLGLRPGNKSSFNLQWTVRLGNIWLQIMKGTCKKTQQKQLFKSCCDNLAAWGHANYRLTLSYLILIYQRKRTNIFIPRTSLTKLAVSGIIYCNDSWADLIKNMCF